ncbi:MAG TPA: hypothetical protein VK050_00240 [Flavobacteriaceae bacterium]|nr:hypothetical protein [Flavobacteriaceae bacterium]
MRLFSMIQSKQKPCFGLVMLWVLFHINHIHAQQRPDSLKPVSLKEVILISKDNSYIKQSKPLSSLDALLESSKNVDMIKRGAYAWEPTMHGMTSERLALTIDGMHIFEACTDKMDPITSYVDSPNLAEAQVGSGQQAAEFGNSIGGGINLQLNRTGFASLGWTGSVETGYETNNKMRVFGGRTSYSSTDFYFDATASFRKASNYKAGGNKEVLFSPFTKYNASFNLGWKLSEGKSLHASMIFDEAKDVGYPALTMDVSLARAFIGSLSYEQEKLWDIFTNWESKLYFNNIKHVMDDTTRPNVPIHMDMPGWSDTYGFYSKTNLVKDTHQFLFKIDGYYNRALAEMTMYPVDPNEALMFMYTWPDVRTTNLGLFVEDRIFFTDSYLDLSIRGSYHNNYVADEFGLNSNKIFHPDMQQSKTRFLKSLSAKYYNNLGDFQWNASVAYGERAPSVSEGYGFFLFNSFDNYDYIGSPDLKNEASAEASVSISFSKPRFEVTADANFFHIYNYIIGVPIPDVSPMAHGADGVKMYENLSYAQILHTSLSARYFLSDAFTINWQVAYYKGQDNERENLPLISPISFKSSLVFVKNLYNASLTMQGAGTQSKFNPKYGESETDAYTIFSADFGKYIFFDNNNLLVKVGVENIFDKEYSTYNDWSNIPRMGRNFYVNLTFSF